MTPKVHYRPIEAAIHWSGLTEHEREILSTLKKKAVPGARDFPEWPTLKLNTERIFDAISNNELPHGIDGVTVHRRSRLTDSHLTVRHIDLKAWMAHYYPEQRPEFLFSAIERELLPPTITVDSLKALTLERSGLRAQIRQLNREVEQLNADIAQLRAAAPTTEYSQPTDTPFLSDRAEMTYLNIIGAMLEVLLGQSPAGQRYSSFTSQEAIITTVVATYGDKLGISQRTLERKFAAGRRTLSDG